MLQGSVQIRLLRVNDGLPDGIGMGCDMHHIFRRQMPCFMWHQYQMSTDFWGVTFHTARKINTWHAQITSSISSDEFLLITSALCVRQWRLMEGNKTRIGLSNNGHCNLCIYLPCFGHSISITLITGWVPRSRQTTAPQQNLYTAGFTFIILWYWNFPSPPNHCFVKPCMLGLAVLWYLVTTCTLIHCIEFVCLRQTISLCSLRPVALCTPNLN